MQGATDCQGCAEDLLEGVGWAPPKRLQGISPSEGHYPAPALQPYSSSVSGDGTKTEANGLC